MVTNNTVLGIVQSLLSSIDGDEVNTHAETQESRQVANILKDIYYDVIFRMEPPEHSNLFELEASGDPTKPVLMYLPSNCLRVDWIKYDNRENGDPNPKFETVRGMALDRFMDMIYRLNPDDANVNHFTFNPSNGTIDVFHYTDRFPQWYTTFDNNTIIFNAYDNTTDTTLTKNKTTASGLLAPEFQFEDDYVPEISQKHYPILLNEVKQAVFAELRQTENMDAARRARRHWVRSQSDKYRLKPRSYYHDELPNYGRRRP